jgi:hypothetical protein
MTEHMRRMTEHTHQEISTMNTSRERVPGTLARLGAAVLGLAALAPAAALASSHREAPSIANDPTADNTDLYAWVSPGAHDRLYVLANYIPLEEPAGGPNFYDFSTSVRYEIHVTDVNRSGLPDLVTYYIEFQNVAAPRVDPADLGAPLGGGKEFFRQLSGASQTYHVTRLRNGERQVLARDVPVAPANIGPRTNAVAYQIPAYDNAFTNRFIQPLGRNGANGRVFAGPRDDGFYVDLAGVFDLANLHLEPGTAPDGVAGFNTHTIALDLPIGDVTPEGAHEIGVWAAASRRKMQVMRANAVTQHYGPWVQVSRLGLPLINEVIIGLQDKDKWNARSPSEDVSLYGAYFLNPVIVRDAEAVGIYALLGVPQEVVDSLKSNRFDIIAAVSLLPVDQVAANLDKIGDVLRVRLDADSQFPNGRRLTGGATRHHEQVDVTDVMMTVALSGGAIALGDGVNYNDRDFLDEFPFLALPHEGFTSSHGRTTPAEN